MVLYTANFEIAINNAATAYTAGDVIDTLKEVDFLSVGTIRNAVLLDANNIGATIKLWLFRAKPIVLADNAAFAPTEADLRNLFGIITFDSFETVNNMKIKHKPDVNLSFRIVSPKIWCYAQAVTAPTYTAANKVKVLLDVWPE